MTTYEDEPPDVEGQKLLSAVERLVDDCDVLIAQVEAYKQTTPKRRDPVTSLELVAARLIATYSTRSALVGGISAAPALLPGAGTAAALIGGGLADMALMLKHEVELALCLTYLYGYDIREERERWVAYLLAGVGTYEADSGRNYFADLAEVQLEAMTLYTPRQLSKLVASVLGQIAVRAVMKAPVRALPVLGIVIGLAGNKLLTSAAGWRCVDALERRRRTEGPHDDEVVDARVS